MVGEHFHPDKVYIILYIYIYIYIYNIIYIYIYILYVDNLLSAVNGGLVQQVYHIKGALTF